MSNKELDELVARSVAAVKAMTPEQRKAMHSAQRRSWVYGELAMGNDQDEARYRMANDEDRKKIDAELTARAKRIIDNGI